MFKVQTLSRDLVCWLQLMPSFVPVLILLLTDWPLLFLTELGYLSLSTKKKTPWRRSSRSPDNKRARKELAVCRLDPSLDRGTKHRKRIEGGGGGRRKPCEARLSVGESRLLGSIAGTTDNAVWTSVGKE